MKITPRRKWRFPFGIERDYQRLLRALTKKLYQNTVDNIQLINSRLDDSDSQLIIKKLIDFYNKTGSLHDTLNQLKGYVNRTNNWTRKEFHEILANVMKVDIFTAEPDLRSLTDEWISENVRLIKSIPQQYHDKLQGIVSRALTQGFTVKNTSTEIKKLYDMTNKRAQLIARDQIATLNAQISQKRQQEAGVEEYIWSTSHDQRVRDSHSAREGVFFKWNNPPEDGHPGIAINCRCVALPVIDTKIFPKAKGKEILEVNKKIPQFEKYKSSPLKQYSQKELLTLTGKLKAVAAKYLPNRSKWSGKINVSKEGIEGKMWNCDIALGHDTCEYIILHELLHSHSVSYFTKKVYFNNHYIEEASVELLNQEICKIEQIPTIESQYGHRVEYLRKINQKIKIANSDFEFAIMLLKVPLPDRQNWLENKIAIYMKEKGTIGDYQELNGLIEKINQDGDSDMTERVDILIKKINSSMSSNKQYMTNEKFLALENEILDFNKVATPEESYKLRTKSMFEAVHMICDAIKTGDFDVAECENN